MRHERSALGLVSVLLACSFEDQPPPVPDGYPQLDEVQEGEADLVIDGQNYVTESGGGTRYNVEGGFEDELRATARFDDLRLTFRDIEVGTYTIHDGELEADYGIDYFADRSCGKGRLEIVGRKRWDRGLLGEGEFMWGTIQLELCVDEYALDEKPPRLEVSGRFTSVITRT